MVHRSIEDFKIAIFLSLFLILPKATQRGAHLFPPVQYAFYEVKNGLLFFISLFSRQIVNLAVFRSDPRSTGKI